MAKELTYATIFKKTKNIGGIIQEQWEQFNKVPGRTEGKTLETKLNQIYYGNNFDANNSIFFQNVKTVIEKKYNEVMSKNYGVGAISQKFLKGDASLEQLRQKINVLSNKLDSNLSEEQINNFKIQLDQINAEINALDMQLNSEVPNTLIISQTTENLVSQLNTLVKKIELRGIWGKVGSIFETSRDMAEKYVDKKLAPEEVEKIAKQLLPGSQRNASTSDFTISSKNKKLGNVSGTYKLEGKAITTKIDYQSELGNESLKNLASLSRKTRLQGSYSNKTGTKLAQFLANDLFTESFTYAYLRAVCGKTSTESSFQEIKDAVKTGLFIIGLTGYGQESNGQVIDYLVVNVQSESRIYVKNTKDLIKVMSNDRKNISMISVSQSIFQTSSELSTLLNIQTYVAITNLQRLFNATAST